LRSSVALGAGLATSKLIRDDGDSSAAGFVELRA